MSVVLNQQQEFAEKLKQVEVMLEKYKGKRGYSITSTARSSKYRRIFTDGSSKDGFRGTKYYIK